MTLLTVSVRHDCLAHTAAASFLLLDRPVGHLITSRIIAGFHPHHSWLPFLGSSNSQSLLYNNQACISPTLHPPCWCYIPWCWMGSLPQCSPSWSCPIFLLCPLGLAQHRMTWLSLDLCPAITLLLDSTWYSYYPWPFFFIACLFDN